MFLERLVIGSNLESITYAFLSDSFFLPTSTGPIFYERLKARILPSSRKDYTWSRLQTILALSGKLLNYEGINSIRVSEDDIKVSSSEGLYKYTFAHCDVFDPTGVSVSNEVKKHKESKYIVHDDFEISQLGGKHQHLEPKLTDDTLASEIHFYTSSRVDGANYVTDCVSESILNKEQINDVDYSDSMVRFSVLRHLESIDVHGNFMNFYKNGMPKFRKPKVVHKKRIIREKEETIYADSEKVKFSKLSMKEILDEFSSTRP